MNLISSALMFVLIEFECAVPSYEYISIDKEVFTSE